MADTPSLTPAELLDHLRADGPRLIAAAGRAGWDAAVPGTDWDVRTLVAHTGAVHRWSADIVRRTLATNETGGSAAFREDVPDAALAGWFADGHAALLDVLAHGDPDAETYRFYRGGSGRDFWTRRQAHETAVHRADAEAAAGEDPVVDAALAQDGLAELAILARNRAFAAALSQRGAWDGARLVLAPDEGPAWTVDFGGEKLRPEPTDDPSGAAAVVSGRAGAVYLWAWNRPAAVTVTGDIEVAGRWRTVRIT
ncbi:maleylpyruvate isomerase mycothiol-dependent enzyme family protein [Jatrophihabitans fulvus]